MAKKKVNIALPSVDELFTSQVERGAQEGIGGISIGPYAPCQRCSHTISMVTDGSTCSARLSLLQDTRNSMSSQLSPMRQNS